MMNVLGDVVNFLSNNIATIISIIAILVAVFNVNEVRKQRVKMYEPTLIIERGSWQSDEDSLMSPHIKIRNVGYGTALDIKCSWILETSLKETKYIQGEGQFVSFTIPSLESGRIMSGIINKENDFKVDFDYLLPVNINQDSIELHSPKIPFLEAIAIVRQLKEEDETNDIHQLFPLKYKLNIEYKDINLGLRKKTYSVTIDIKFVDFQKYQIENKIVLSLNIESNSI